MLHSNLINMQFILCKWDNACYAHDALSNRFFSVSVDLDIPYNPVTYNILDIDSNLKYYAD